MKRILCALGLSLALVAPAAGEIYRWRDRQGKLHFSDTPPHLETEKVGLFLNDGIKAVAAPKPLREEKPRRAEKKPLSAKDYQINFSARRRGNEVAVSGRIGNGPDCPGLKVSVEVQDERGTRRTVKGVVGNVGYGRSDLLDACTRVPSSSGDDWTITDIDVYCRQ